ncbi:MAG: isoprenylcysteine carboxylmethyltransferase family protein [Bacteroidia bacterium]
MKIQYLACFVVFTFFVMDFIIRKDRKATSIKKTEEDKGSMKIIALTFLVIIICTEILKYFGIGEFSNLVIATVALIFMFLGLGIRIYSMLTLKKSYTRTLLTTAKQELIRTGLYKTIRHPGYLGTILIWMFFGLAIENYIITIIGVLLIIVAYSYRINNEEKMLQKQFGQEYQDYQKVTWRIIPYIW